MSEPKKDDQLVVYVAMAKKRLVIPIHQPKQKVFELGALIAARFRVERVAELRTQGFLLDGNDVIGDVLRDGSVIECLDYIGWVDENNSMIVNNRNCNWIELENADFLDDKVKWIRAGWAQNIGKFFVKIGGERQGWAPMQLDMFEPADLMQVAKKGKFLASQVGDEKSGWFASAEFTANAAGVVDTVTIRCKSKSDPREAIKSMKIIVTPGTEKPVVQDGEVKEIQKAEIPEEKGVEYTLPADDVKGPVYPEVEAKDPKAPKPEPPEIKGEGSLPLLITCKMKPEIDRGYQRNIGDVWDQTINLECEFLNRGEQSLILTKWGAEYKTTEGKWEPLKLTRGQRQGFYNYRWESAAAAKDSIPIYGKSPQRYAFGVSLPINAPQLSRPRALHGSLPNPLELKYTVSDVNGGSVSIVIPVVSSIPADLDLITLTKEKNNNGHGKEVVGYVQCDDTAAEGRIAATIYKKVRDGYEDEFEIRQNLENSYQTFKATEFKRIGFQQAAKGVSEFKLEKCGASSSGCTIDVFALIDIPRKKVYAIKLALKTSTSNATKTFLLDTPAAAAPAKTA